MNSNRFASLYLSLLGLASLLCVVWVSVFLLRGSLAPQESAAPKPSYLLRDNAGKVALYTAAGEGPLAQYDIYTRLLPQADVLALQRGVPVQDEAALQRLLEDYGM